MNALRTVMASACFSIAARRSSSLNRVLTNLNSQHSAVGCWNVALVSSIRSLAAAATATSTATKEKKKSDTTNAAENEVGYWDSKKAAKDRRRELYLARQDRLDRLKVRRSGRPKDEKKVAFQSFFMRKKVQDEVWDRRARQAGMEWKIRVAVLVERIAVVLPDKEPWEKDYDNMKAHLNLFGKLYPKELIGDVDLENAHTNRPMTDEELLAQLPFTPAPRETEADASGDVHTLDRKLKTKIYLMTLPKQQKKDKSSASANPVWQLPTVDLKEDETLLDAAKRAVPELVGDDLEFWCPSNAPWTVDLQAYDTSSSENESPVKETKKEKGKGDDDCKPEQQQQYYGTKTFVIKVQHSDGDVSPNDKMVQDFAWLDRHEIVDRVKQQEGEHKSQYYYYML